MTSDILSQVLNATPARPNEVISEQHDTSKINVEGIEGGDAAFQRRVDAIAPGGWDAYEYGVSREEAVRIVREQGQRGIERLKQMALRRASLNTRNGRVAVVGVGELFWHGLGTIVRDALTSADAMRLGELAGWKLDKLPQSVNLDGVQVPTGAFAMVRRDVNQVLGTVGSGYEPFTNEEGFEFADEVLISTGLARYEAAGAIGNGEKVFLLARRPEECEAAPGDVMTKFIMLLLSHDGTGAIKMFGTNVRACCKNTTRTAEQGRKGGINLRHTKNVKAKVAAAQAALGLIVKDQDEFDTRAKLLARTSLESPKTYFDTVLDATAKTVVAGKVYRESEREAIAKHITGLPQDEREDGMKQFERAVRARRNTLDELLERHDSDRNNRMAGIEGTAWAAVNAVTEHANHGMRGYKGDDRKRGESRFQSVVSGRSADLCDVAMDVALTYAN